MGERRRGNEGAQRPTDLAAANPEGGAQSPPKRLPFVKCWFCKSILIITFFIKLLNRFIFLNIKIHKTTNIYVYKIKKIELLNIS